MDVPVAPSELIPLDLKAARAFPRWTRASIDARLERPSSLPMRTLFAGLLIARVNENCIQAARSFVFI